MDNLYGIVTGISDVFILNVCIPLIISIFAFSLPLLLNAAGRIDEKYHSVLLIKLFRKEACCRFFLWMLMLSIVAILFFILKLPRLWDFGVFNIWVENSSSILLLLFTVLLIVATFWVVWLIYKYNVQIDLLDRLIEKYKSRKNDNVDQNLLLKGISQIMYYSINQADEDLARKCLEFFFSEFIELRKGRAGEVIKYPSEFYNVAFEANELLCKRDKRTISFYNDGTIYEWFFDGYQSTILSEETFSLLWRCLVRNVEYEKDDFIVSFWKKSHQYFELFLQRILPQYDLTGSMIINNDEIKRRDVERKRFLEFHFALGGLLMYRKKFLLLKELVSYTNTKPPKHVLVPDSFSDIIIWYMEILKDDYLNPVYYEKKYPFPEISGINGNDVIRNWITYYLAMLLLRLYSLDTYYINDNHFELPVSPHNLTDLKMWEENLGYLEKQVTHLLSEEKDVLEQLALGNVTNSKWFDESKMVKPIDLIKNYKTKIRSEAISIKQTQEIDTDKENKFLTQTKKILNNAFSLYKNFWNERNFTQNYQHIFLGGRSHIMDKMAFAADQDKGYFNADSFLAEMVAKDFLVNALRVFAFMSHDRYLLLENDLFDALANLNLNREEFVVLSTGISLQYFHDFVQVKNLEKSIDDGMTKWTYNGLKIFSTEHSHPSFGQSLLIVRKSDLPYLEHQQVKSEDVEKYHLNEIDPISHIYASIIDLNTEVELREEMSERLEVADLTDKVLVNVDYKSEIRFSRSSKFIQLKVFNQFEDRGEANKIEDVQNIWNLEAKQ